MHLRYPVHPVHLRDPPLTLPETLGSSSSKADTELVSVRARMVQGC